MFQEFIVVEWDQVNKSYKVLGPFSVNVNAIVFLRPFQVGYCELVFSPGDVRYGSSLIVQGSYEDLKKLLPFPVKISPFQLGRLK